MEARAGVQQINALVPLSEMFGYSNDLRSKTQGRGQYSMEHIAILKYQVYFRKDYGFRSNKQ